MNNMDFDYERRDDVFKYVIGKYGQPYCCKIGTYNSLKARAVIRAVSKALDVGKDWEAYQDLKKKFPNVKVEMPKNSLNIADKIAKSIPAIPNMTVAIAYKDCPEFRTHVDKYE
jgi:DNA polymerase-3 subunit alpha